MKNINIFFLGAFASLTLISCNKEQEPQYYNSFEGITESETSKTTIDGLAINWVKDDEIQIATSTTPEGLPYKATTGGSTSTSFVPVSDEVTDSEYYAAFYPAGKFLDFDFSDIIFYGNIPAIQATTVSSLPMIAYSSSTKLQFKNAGSVLRVNVAVPTGGSMDIASISVIADKAIVGDIKVDYNEGAPIITTSTLSSAEASNTVTLIVNETITATKAYDIVVMPETYIATFVVTLKSGVKLTWPDKEISLERSKVMKANTTYGSTLLVDLTDAPANCIIAPVGATYKFKAVKGNTSTSVGEVNGQPYVLWSTYNTTTAPSTDCEIIKGGDDAPSIDANGIITVKTTGTSGNAVVAVKNSSDEIIWSWHIWCSDYKGTLYTIPSGKNIMDRNLGALSAVGGTVESLGFFYQYGRKDPFVASSSVSLNKQDVAVRGEAINLANVEDGRATPSDAVGNPTTFWYGKENWCIEDEPSRWDGDAKNVNDPCPAGYRIPDKNSFQEFTTANLFYESVMWKYTENENVYFYMGHRDYSGAVTGMTGQSANVWTSDHESYKNAKYFRITLENVFVSSQVRSCGLYVRCISEE